MQPHNSTNEANNVMAKLKKQEEDRAQIDQLPAKNKNEKKQEDAAQTEEPSVEIKQNTNVATETPPKKVAELPVLNVKTYTSSESESRVSSSDGDPFVGPGPSPEVAKAFLETLKADDTEPEEEEEEDMSTGLMVAADVEVGDKRKWADEDESEDEKKPKKRVKKADKGLWKDFGDGKDFDLKSGRLYDPEEWNGRDW